MLTARSLTWCALCSLLTLKGLDKLLVHLLGDPAKLTWLDLSCNQLSSIEDVVTTFPNLQVGPSAVHCHVHGLMDE